MGYKNCGAELDIPADHPAFAATGLRQASRLRLSRPTTLVASLVCRRLGALPPELQGECQQVLRRVLGRARGAPAPAAIAPPHGQLVGRCLWDRGARQACKARHGDRRGAARSVGRPARGWEQPQGWGQPPGRRTEQIPALAAEWAISRCFPQVAAREDPPPRNPSRRRRPGEPAIPGATRAEAPPPPVRPVPPGWSGAVSARGRSGPVRGAPAGAHGSGG